MENLDQETVGVWGLKPEFASCLADEVQKAEVEEKIKAVFAPRVGGEEKIKKILLRCDRNKHPYAKVWFVDEASAAMALQLHGESVPDLSDGELRVQLAEKTAHTKAAEDAPTIDIAADVATKLAQNPRFAEKCRGKKGDAGPAGVAGPQGPKGDAGKDGAQGQKGDPGPKGPTGADGAVGPKGTDGAKGPQGPAGQLGPEGLRGPQGRDAPRWPHWILVLLALAALIIALFGTCSKGGEQGPTGLQGPMGEVGPRGLPGLQGPPGSKGEVGPQGEKAPEVAPPAPEPPPAAPAADDGHRGPRVVGDRFDNVERRFHAIDDRLDALEAARR